MWVYDYKTQKEYSTSSPRSKFCNYVSIEIEPIAGKPCAILVKKGMEEGRKPFQILEQLNIFNNLIIS